MGIELVMMNIEACQLANEQIIVGQNTTGQIDGVNFDWPVLSKTTFSVTLQGPTNRLTVPIEFTDAYKRIQPMRTPLPTEGTEPKGRGRPKRQTGSVAPVEQPGIPPSSQQPPANPYLPPGYTGPVQAGMAVSQPPAQPQPQPQAPVMQPPQQPQPQTMTLEQAQGGEDWPERSLDDAIENLNEHLLTIITGIRKDAAEAIKASVSQAIYNKPKRLTCFDCVYVDMANFKCSKFDAVPPMHVIATAVSSCSEFIEVDADLGDEIPF